MKTLTLLLLVAIAALYVLTTQAQNLLVNPYFTDGFSGWNGTYGLDNGAMNPPPQYGNTVGVVDASEPAMYQSFPTVVGTTYQVIWDVRLPDLGGDGVPIVGESTVGPALLNIDLNGLFLQDLIQNRTTWQSYTVNFVATGTSSTLSFSAPEYLPSGSRSEYVFMDYASAVAVPEPAFWTMLVFLFAYLARRVLVVSRCSE